MKSLFRCLAVFFILLGVSQSHAIPIPIHPIPPIPPTLPSYATFEVTGFSVSPNIMSFPCSRRLFGACVSRTGIQNPQNFSASIYYSAAFQLGFQPGRSSSLRLLNYSLILQEDDVIFDDTIGAATGAPHSVFDRAGNFGFTNHVLSLPIPTVSPRTLNDTCDVANCSTVAGRLWEGYNLEFTLDSAISYIDVQFDEVPRPTRYFLDGRTEAAPIPEPSSFVLLLVGLGLLNRWRSRLNKPQASV